MLRRLALLLPVLLPALPLACFNPGAPLTVSFDGGVLPTVGLPDGSLPDVTLFSLPEPEGGPDAAPDGPVAPVTVTVISDFGPEPGVPLVVADAAGHPVLPISVTGPQGSAALAVPAGGSVTAVLGQTSSNYSFVTYLAVEPGDTLTVLDTTDVSQYSVDVTAPPPPPGSPQYINVYAGNCYTSGTPTTLRLATGCYGAGLFPLLVTAEDQSSFAETAYTFAKGLSLAAVADGGFLTGDLSAATWNTDVGSQVVTATNVPPELIPGINVDLTLGFSEVANGVAALRLQQQRRHRSRRR